MPGTLIFDLLMWRTFVYFILSLKNFLDLLHVILDT